MPRNDDAAPKRGRAGQPPLALERFMPYLLNRITNRLNLDLRKALRRHGLTQQRWRVLAVLRAGDGRRIMELAVYTVMNQSTLSRVVDQMERDGLAERRPSADDQRVIEVHLTDRGRALYDAIYPIAMAQAAHALEGFSEADVQTLNRLLGRIMENIRRSPFP